MKPAVQMYTLREFTKTPEALDEALRQVAAIGYPAVQLSAVGAWDAGLLTTEELRSMLDRHGLVCCATHRPVDRFLNHLEEEVEVHRTLGCGYTAVGSIGAEFGLDLNAYNRFASHFVPVIMDLNKAGVLFGYHNHAHEFMHQHNSRTPLYDVLFDVPNLMLEIDTYWVAVAGHSPQALLERAAGRIPAIHLKDLEIVGWEGAKFAPVGEGNLDWDAIVEACRSGGTEWAIVEQDTCRRDPFDCLASSYRFLSAQLG